jgi:hypothetical protein
MSFPRRPSGIYAGLSAIALAGLFLGAEPLAGKSGSGTSPPPAPGTIYFQIQQTGAWMSMKGDGTSKREVAVISTTPSYQRHGGFRFSLLWDYDLDGNVDEWGNPIIELFATSESGSEFQLTGDPTIHQDFSTPAWAKDDSFVSYTATADTPNGPVGGLYVVTIDWSTGSPVPGPQMFLIGGDITQRGDVNLYNSDWSPAGNEVAYWANDSTGVAHVYVTSFSSSGAATRLLATGQNPAWSLDGSRIAFDRSEIWTIKPDGTGAIRITQHSVSKQAEQSQFAPTWSPDGAYLAYLGRTSSGSKTAYAVMRIPSAGGTAVNLTSAVGNSSAQRWRP